MFLRCLPLALAAFLSACASSYVHPESAEYSYAIELPETEAAGPHPAVLFMPACSGGLVARNVLENNHARHLREHGFATVMFDPVSRRGIRDGETEICRSAATAWNHYYLRVQDVKHFLEEEAPHIEAIDSGRIGLFGQSGGGIAGFRFASSQFRKLDKLPDTLSAIVVDQSACGQFQVGQSRFWDTPMLLIAPEKDELNPYRRCIDIAESSEHVEVLVLSGASHAYDWPYPSRTVYVVNRHVKMWPSMRASELARERTVEFFRTHLM